MAFKEMAQKELQKSELFNPFNSNSVIGENYLDQSPVLTLG